MRSKTQEARLGLSDALEMLAIAGRMHDADRERRFTFRVAQYLEALKRSHNASEGALAVQLGRLVFNAQYAQAIELWEKQK